MPHIPGYKNIPFVPSALQLRTLKHIGAFMDDKGYSPSVRELAALLGVSYRMVQRDIYGPLVRKGLIRLKPMLGRTVQLTHWGEYHAYGQIRAAMVAQR